MGALEDLANDIRVKQAMIAELANHESQTRWDTYFLDIAEVVRQKSKDPSSKIGAVVTQHNTIISTGFNGFPIGIADLEERYNDRPTKYRFVSHAERNALAAASANGVSTRGATLYLVGFGPPTVPCIECSKQVIQSGIIRVVGRPFIPARPDWLEDLEFSVALLKEAGVKFDDFGKPCPRIGAMNQ